MLGQICYKDFYENPEMPYQEVSPRRARIYVLLCIVLTLVTDIRYSRTSLLHHNLLRQASQPLPCSNCQRRSQIPRTQQIQNPTQTHSEISHTEHH